MLRFDDDLAPDLPQWMESVNEIEQHLRAASGGAPDAETPRASRPRLGGVSFLPRFGSALNHHVHLHACVTDGVFVPAAAAPAGDAPPTFLPARPITPSDLASVGVWLVFPQENVPDPFWATGKRDRHRLLPQTEPVPAAAAADMLAWVNSGFSVDASVRITLLPPQVRVYRQPLEHLLRSSTRPSFALERLSVIRDADGRIIRIRYVLLRHKAANWVGPGRKRKSTRPGATGVVELTPPRVPRPARRSRPAAAEAPASLSRCVCAESQAQAGRDRARDREHRQAVRRRCRRAWGRRSRHGRLLRRESKAPLARHVMDCLGETTGPSSCKCTTTATSFRDG
jgi:hypothetical protein